MNLKNKIRTIPDFPKEGILFYDITTILMDPAAFKEVISELTQKFSGKRIDKVIGIDARGFILAAPLADRLNAGFVPVRKSGKLPYKTIKETYSLEYGNASIEIHEDAIKPGEKILIADDLLATGGTMEATVALVNKLKGDIVGIALLVELLELKGRDRLRGNNIVSLLQF